MAGLDLISKTSTSRGWTGGSINPDNLQRKERNQRISLFSIYEKDLLLSVNAICNNFLPLYSVKKSKLKSRQVRRSGQHCTASFETAISKELLIRSVSFPGRLPMLNQNRGLRHSHHGGSVTAKAVEQEAGTLHPAVKQVTGFIHLAFSLGFLLTLDKFLKRAFAAASIRFPSALFGMFCLFSLLMLLDSIRPAIAEQIVALFAPATRFIQRWLPLFYVPSLVVVPLAVKGIPPSAGVKITVILVAGWAASLAVAGYTAVMVRKIIRTELVPGQPVSKSLPFTTKEFVTWSVVMGLSFIVAAFFPTAFGTLPLTALPFLLASTVVGYILGSRLSGKVKKILHPIISCALAADLAAFILGKCTGAGFEHALGLYLTKNVSDLGAGDLLMGFLGTVILSFAFSMFRQRKLVQRHSAEIFSSIFASSIFSLYSTAIVGRLLALDPLLIRALVPRCVTVALALPIASLLEAQNASLTAAVVVLTGLVGANFAQMLMDHLGLYDPIARGIATASSAHGLGTAALSQNEPEALPFCAIAYALTGIFCSVICSIPVVQKSLIMISG